MNTCLRCRCVLAAVAALALVSVAAAPPRADICPVHGVKMEPVTLRLVYGLPSRTEFEEMREGKTRFPFGRDYVLGGCVLRHAKTVAGFLCPKCVEARRAWLAARGR